MELKKDWSDEEEKKFVHILKDQKNIIDFEMIPKLSDVIEKRKFEEAYIKALTKRMHKEGCFPWYKKLWRKFREKIFPKFYRHYV